MTMSGHKKKEGRESSEESKKIQVSNPTISENSIAAEDLLDFVDKYINQIEDLTANIFEVEQFMKKVLYLLIKKASDKDFEKLIESGKEANSYLSSTFLPVLLKIHDQMKERIYE